MIRGTWGVLEVMNFTGLGRKAAIHVLNTEGCPVLPRVKNGKFRVPAEAFVKWWNGGRYE